jgi:hypothetical protein
MPGPSTSSRSATRLTAAAAAAVTAVVLAACGGAENYIDQGSLEEGLLAEAPASAQAESASCPEEVSSDVGTEFECTVTTANGEVVVGAEVTSEGDEDVEFEVTTVDGEPVAPQ